ncbi:MAG: hypothetical protein ACI8V8_001331 [Chitinophagales bacterium]|jgi:hypothetical protein
MEIDFKKQILPHFIAIIAILGFSIALFAPSLDGSKVVGPDSISSAARYKYILDYKEETGKNATWNPSQFAGDPRVLALGKESNLLGIVHQVFTLNVWYPIGMFFAIGLAMYLSLCLMGVNSWIGLIVSLGYMLSYIFFTLYEAGHGQKVLTLAYIPLVVSGTIMLLGKKKLHGILALLIGTSLAIFVGHVQMVFYLIIALVAFGIPLIIFALKDKTYKSFSTGLAIAIVVALVAVGTDYSQLKSTYEFSKQTMRGGSILEGKTEADAPDETKSSGLKWDYAMSWSFQAKEFLTIVVPRIAGGGSQEKIDKENPIAKLMMQNGSKVKNDKVAVPAYWGSMPFTSGGVYVGASVLCLFMISLFFIERKYAFAFGSAFLMIFLLSMGKHAEWFNRMLFDFLPMFSKFRAPSSAVSILPAFIFLQVGMGLHQLVEEEKTANTIKFLLIGTGISVGFLILVFLVGSSSFGFLSPNDLNYEFNIQSILIEGRKELFKADVMRSIVFMLLAAGSLFLYLKEILKSKYLLYVILAGIFIMDLLPIDRRIVSNDDFITETVFENQFTARQADLQILKAEPNGRGFYRVLDLSVNTFNDAKSCYYHNQVGGYSATKMQRYQDMIEYHIAKNNMEVLNMLNTKYFITREGAVQQNPEANGNAWFVSSIQYVETDKAEIEALNTIQTKQTAVIKKDEFGEVQVGDGSGNIALRTFLPEKMVYESSSNANQFAVFSETWYNGKTGWVATIDGEETPILRANYILRGIEIPSGKHEVIMEFKPVPPGRMISIASSIVSLVLIIGVILISLGVVKIDNFDLDNL